MQFSVIIPTFNRANLLAETLASVFAQTFSDFEVIVVDDGSTDATSEVAAEFAGKVRFLQQSNKGPGAARNLGAAQAQGEYLVFLDSDDVFFPWTLARYAEIIAAHGKPSFLAGKPLRFDQTEQLSNATDELVSTKSFADYLASGDEWRWWGVSSFVVRRDVFQGVGGFTNEWVNGEDADLAMRLGVARGFVQVTTPHMFGYREHAVSAMKNQAKTLAGTWHAVRAEQAGHYPGGPVRARERWRILTRHLRPVTLDCLQHGLRSDAWGLYRAMFRWHFALGRWKYLAGFPVKALLS